ncbi:hypothetical protein M977_04691 [Buttiauxella gaviniae ATCC 51604]|uniref:Uncharacterized protein n=1 Tax=Buttiauxella gaviniae ATCC 51604 TaxID=1354253 RepID=A0A1B7HJB2_9ENTR|nr:hypothetical protein M977_04691 [Buttiauxella gaviniae ATCC 51604]
MNAAELEKIHTEIARLMAQTSKINRETIWYPVVLAAGLIGTVAIVGAVWISKIIVPYIPCGLFS